MTGAKALKGLRDPKKTSNIWTQTGLGEVGEAKLQHCVAAGKRGKEEEGREKEGEGKAPTSRSTAKKSPDKKSGLSEK